MKKNTLRFLSAALCVILLCTSLFCAVGCSNVSTPYDGIRFSKYVKLGSYNVTINKSEVDESVEETIQSFIKNYAEVNKVDREARKGDNVTITTEIWVYNDEGKLQKFDEFAQITEEGISANLTEYTIENLGNGDFHEEIENAILGAKTLEKVEAAIKYDDKVQTDELKNRDAVIYITVNKIEEVIYPDYSDAFVASKTEYDTIEEYEAALRLEIERSIMWSEFVENCKIKDYPKEKITQYTQEMYELHNAYAEYYKMELEDFISNYYGITMTEYDEQVLDYAKGTVQEELVLYYVVKKMKLTISEEEYVEYCESVLDYYDCEDIDELEEDYGREAMERNIYWEAVKDMLYEKLTIVDDTADAE